jgi:hypothetical protein
MLTADHRYVVAVDVGQANDYTALAVLHHYQTFENRTAYEQASTGEARLAGHHDLVHLERFRDLGYPAQVRRVEERFAEVKRHAAETDRYGGDVSLVVDATGVGKPILDMFRDHGLHARGVIITGGETSSHADGLDRVPKRELVTTLQIALQARRLRIAEELPLAELLLQEFRGFRVKITLTGHAKFGNDVGAWREADHDDLVLAVALGVWTIEHRRVTSYAAARVAARLL